MLPRLSYWLAAPPSSSPTEQYGNIARYSLLHAWAQQLGLIYAAQLLRDTLDEEVLTEKLFGQFAAGNLEQARISEAA
jgi:ferritin-like metal-binding protein YciE